MLPEDEESIWRAILTPGYRLQWKQDENEVLANAILRLERSSDPDISVDREDPTASLQWTRKNPRGEFHLGGVYEEASTRITEFDDTGNLIADGTRTQMLLETVWEHLLTEQSVIGLMGDYRDVSYDKGNFVDYTQAGAGVNYAYRLSEDTISYLQLLGASYEPDDAMVQST
jgi:hypothetical protein